MPRYTYTAKTGPQQSIQGELEAESEQDAINKLSKKGYFPVSVQAKDLSVQAQPQYLRKVSKRDLLSLTSQLATLNESGLNLLNSLNIILTQTPNRYLKGVLSDIISRIKDGKSLSESLASYPDLFSSLYIAMVHSGEIGGTLEESLRRLSGFLEQEEELRNSLRSALAYPIFVLTVGFLTILVLLGFVIPRLVTMFEDMGQALPLPTQILIQSSEILRYYWWLILSVVIILFFVVRRFRASPGGKLIWDTFKLRLKAWGEIVLKTEISRLSRTLSLLLSSGVPIIYALDVAGAVVQNEVLKTEIQKFKGQISSGLSFSQCLKESKLFPAPVTNIVAIGEETGALEKSLQRIADDYERQVNRSLNIFSRLLEPAIILVMGLIVGFIVLSMLLPIFQINLIAR